MLLMNNFILNLADLGQSFKSERKALGLTQAQVDSAKGDLYTILPAGLTRPAHWQDLAPPDDES